MTQLITSSSTKVQTNVQSVKMTTQLMFDTLQAYIRRCHDGEVSDAVGAWYRQDQNFQNAGMKGRDLNHAMYNWAQAELQTAETQLRIVH